MKVFKTTISPLYLYVLLLVPGLFFGVIDCSGRYKETRVTIAVLPFADVSAEKGLAYFCEGIAEDVLCKLMQVKDLRVTDRHSSFVFTGSEYDVGGIGEELDVTYVLTGQVNLAEKVLSISVQLIEAARNRRVFGGTFKGNLEDLFELQEGVFGDVLKTLSREAEVVIDDLNTGRDTENVDAFINYTLGRFYWLNKEAGSIVKSVEHLQAAVEADTAYALAHATLADAYAVMGYMGVIEPKHAFESCGAAAEEAVKLNGGLSEAHSALGWKHFLYDWDWVRAERELELAIDLYPDNATARYRYASFLLAMGRLEEADVQIEVARRSSPLWSLLPLTKGRIRLAAGDFKEAKNIFEKLVETEPDLIPGYVYLAQAYLAIGEDETALKRVADGAQEAGGTEALLTMLGHAYGKITWEDQAREILEELELLSQKVYVSSWNAALIHMGIGDKEKALEFLNKAVEEKYPLVCFINVMPIWEDLRDEPGFQEILTTIGLER